MIFIFIIGLIALFAVVVILKNKISFDFGSFLRKTIPLDRGQFGIYCFTGKQGSGKTYSLVKYIKKHRHEALEIYSNISIGNLEYTEITSIEQLLSLKDKQHCFIIYDEIFTYLQKQSKISPELMEFMTQQRKMRNIFFTTAQEWLEIPITFRRFVKIQIECSTIALGRLGGLLIEAYHDAYQMKWDQLENEYVAPLIRTKISKYERRFMQSYDTFERVRSLQK